MIADGCVILPHAVVNTNCMVKQGCIINCGAIVDHGCILEEGVHVGPGAIVKAGEKLRKPKYKKVEAGRSDPYSYLSALIGRKKNGTACFFFKNNGKLKLLIIVGTRPEIIRLAAVIKKCRQYFDMILAHTGQKL